MWVKGRLYPWRNFNKSKYMHYNIPALLSIS